MVKLNVLQEAVEEIFEEFEFWAIKQIDSSKPESLDPVEVKYWFSNLCQKYCHEEILGLGEWKPLLPEEEAIEKVWLSKPL